SRAFHLGIHRPFTTAVPTRPSSAPPVSSCSADNAVSVATTPTLGTPPYPQSRAPPGTTFRPRPRASQEGAHHDHHARRRPRHRGTPQAGLPGPAHLHRAARVHRPRLD